MGFELRRAAAATVLLTGALGCGGPSGLAVVGTARAPGADGTVQVEEIEGGNSLVTLSMTNLVPPSRLGDDLRTYVVWFQDGGRPVKAGTLEYDEDTRAGSMMATTPLSEFTLKITAESAATVTSPGDVVVAERRVSAE